MNENLPSRVIMIFDEKQQCQKKIFSYFSHWTMPVVALVDDVKIVMHDITCYS